MAKQNEQVPPKSLLDDYDDDIEVEFDDLPGGLSRKVYMRDLKEMEEMGMITIHQHPDGSIFFRLTDAAYQYTAASRN